MSELIIFKDKECKEPLSQADFIEVEVGTSKNIEAYLTNTSERFTITSIKEAINDKDVAVFNIPHILYPKESKPITITFKPSLNRDEGLHSDIFFSGKLIKP